MFDVRGACFMIIFNLLPAMRGHFTVNTWNRTQKPFSSSEQKPYQEIQSCKNGSQKGFRSLQNSPSLTRY